MRQWENFEEFEKYIKTIVEIPAKTRVRIAIKALHPLNRAAYRKFKIVQDLGTAEELFGERSHVVVKRLDKVPERDRVEWWLERGANAWAWIEESARLNAGLAFLSAYSQVQMPAMQ